MPYSLWVKWLPVTEKIVGVACVQTQASFEPLFELTVSSVLASETTPV